MNVPYAIKFENVKKQYRFGQIGGGTLSGALSSCWSEKKGRENPNLKIGEDRKNINSTFFALESINLTIQPGEAVGIIGRNGAGKSTLLKLLSRVTLPTEGTIDVYGRIASMLEVGTGFNGEMTGRENIYMNGAILGMSKAEIDSKMDDIIAFSEIEEFIDTPVKRYSSGMYVKLAFSVAAHLDSEILIMDEVLAVGDKVFQKKCIDRMREAASCEGRTVLYVSHNMATIRKLCNRCIVLSKGNIIYDGDVENAIECYMDNSDQMKSYREYQMEDYLNKNISIFKILSTDLNHDDCQYGYGENIYIDMKCVAKKDLSDVHLRFQIASNDGSYVGSSFLKESLFFNADEETLLHIKLPTDNLFMGKYHVEVAIYISNDKVDNRFINTLKNGFCFEIDPRIVGKAEHWSTSWGHVRLLDSTVVLD